MSAVVTLPTFTRFPRPKHGPRRDYRYLTEEPSITRVCRALGKEPQPWQRYVWAIGTEHRIEHGQRVYHYGDVLASTPRQSGKTTLLQPLRVYRMIRLSGAHLFSTAQTQKHASKRMLDMVGVIEASTMAPLFHTRHGKGDAGMKLLANGADLAQFTPNEEAAHGETSPYFDLDEIWFFSKDLGDTIMGGIRPSQITLHGLAQRWYTSTMGTAAQSGFMNELVEAGRAGTKPGLAYFEWSMPDGMEPYDPATWWTFHPALGNTITEDGLAADIDMPGGEWLRAYMNRLTEVSDTLMPMEAWDDLAGNPIPPALREVTIGFEVAPGNTCAAVVAAWHELDGTPVVRVLHQAPGTRWVIDYLRHLRALGAGQPVADAEGPARRLVDAMGEDEVRTLTFAERRLADQTILSVARDDATLIHDGSQPLRVAMANAQTRIRNGVELIDRDRSTQPVPSLIAASVALYADAHRPVSLGLGIAS